MVQVSMRHRLFSSGLWAALLIVGLCLSLPSEAVAAGFTAAKPMVAVHVSSYTEALHGTPQSPGSSSDVLGMYYDSFSHDQVRAMLEEALRGDGTPFVEVSDADIENGALLTNGQPTYPIVFSLDAEVVSDAEVSAIRNYVSAGGQAYVGGSSWTRRPDGTYREASDGHTEFALANEMGLTSLAVGTNPQGGTWAWGLANTIRRTSDDPLVAHLTAGAD